MKINHSYKLNKSTIEKIENYSQKIKFASLDSSYSSLEASIRLPMDETIFEDSKAMYQTFNKDIKFVFIIGIGGSNLGTQAIYKAFETNYADLHSSKLRFIFLDTISDLNISDVNKILNNKITKIDDFLIVLISKSGKTTETIANFEVCYKIFADKFENVSSRVVTITDKGSLMDELSQKLGIKTLNLEKNVGGRFSVFSNVGIFPLFFYFEEDSIKKLLQGAKDMILDLIKNPSENVASVSASIIYEEYLKGTKINNLFFFNENLEVMGKWYRQLMGESIGKKENINSMIVRDGITPIVSIGSTDLHSMAQLYFGGPKDKLTTLIKINKVDTSIVEKGLFTSMVPNIEGKSFERIMEAIYSGVKGAYEVNELSHVELMIEKLDEYNIGQFLQFKMIEIMLLANLMDLNAFDQPSVEDYKTITKKYLD